MMHKEMRLRKEATGSTMLRETKLRSEAHSNTMLKGMKLKSEIRSNTTLKETKLRKSQILAVSLFLCAAALFPGIAGSRPRGDKVTVTLLDKNNRVIALLGDDRRCEHEDRGDDRLGIFCHAVERFGARAKLGHQHLIEHHPLAADDLANRFLVAQPHATPDRIEALDMGRRGLHDEGSRIVMERLKRKVELDFDTARRLFTLITVLHWKG